MCLKVLKPAQLLKKTQKNLQKFPSFNSTCQCCLMFRLIGPCYFQRTCVVYVQAIFGYVIYNVACSPTLPDVIFNVVMLPITCSTFKRNESNIPYNTAVNPWYCYIYPQNLMLFRYRFLRCFQRSHVDYVQADPGNVICNIPRCLMFSRFFATLFWTSHVRIRCAGFSRLSRKFLPYWQIWQLSP